MREKLIEEARKRISSEDPSHDFNHAMRVLANAEYISGIEGGDLEIIVPAALFHDIIVYPKNSPKSKDSAADSAVAARNILMSLQYPAEKIPMVEEAIREHSYSNGCRPSNIESKIVQDADRLEATGAIAVMRTFCSAGQMKKMLYSPDDPFCSKRNPDSLSFAVDLFYKRLLKVQALMNTETARKMAETRTVFLHNFLNQLSEEIKY